MIIERWNIHQTGIFICQKCQNELFSTDRQDKYKTIFMLPFSKTSVLEIAQVAMPKDSYTYEKGKVLCQKCHLEIGYFEVIEWGILGATKFYHIDSNLLWLKVK